MVKRKGVILYRVFLIFLLLFFIITNAEASEKRYFIPIENSPSIGPEDAPVTIVEFLDYQ